MKLCLLFYSTLSFLPQTLTGHSSPVFCLKPVSFAASNTDASYVLSAAADDRHISVWYAFREFLMQNLREKSYTGYVQAMEFWKNYGIFVLVERMRAFFFKKNAGKIRPDFEMWFQCLLLGLSLH